MSFSGFLGAMGLGTLAAVLFALSFVANRVMAVQGEGWEWTASLRFLYSVPIFSLIVAARGGLPAVLRALHANSLPWTMWSTVGFGIFYAPMCLAAVTAPGWVVASTWQITIVCGVLLSPYLNRDQSHGVPSAALLLSTAILTGVALTQLGQHTQLSKSVAEGIVAVLIAAVAYPAGNRKTMNLAGDELDTFQRLLAMSLASLPFWLLIAAVGAARTGFPPADQLIGTAIVAICSGVLATALFFTATHRVRHRPSHLAGVEATQAGEVVFVAAAEPFILSAPPPSLLSWIGITIIGAGVLGHALTASRTTHQSRHNPT